MTDSPKKRGRPEAHTQAVALRLPKTFVIEIEAWAASQSGEAMNLQAAIRALLEKALRSQAIGAQAATGVDHDAAVDELRCEVERLRSKFLDAERDMRAELDAVLASLDSRSGGKRKV